MTEPVLVQARRELLAFAAVSRPGWDPARLDGAVRAAQDAGWDWERIVMRVARLIVTVTEDPRDLLFEAGQTRAQQHRAGGMPADLKARVLEDAAAAAARHNAAETADEDTERKTA